MKNVWSSKQELALMMTYHSNERTECDVDLPEAAFLRNESKRRKQSKF